MRRPTPAPASLTDVGLAVFAVALTAIACWIPTAQVGTPVAGPPWLRVVFPLVFAAPLAWRQSAPLAALAGPLGALAVQAVLTADSPEGLELILVVGVAVYSVAAHADRRKALVGLGAALATYTVYALANNDIRSGQAGELWAGSFFLVAMVAAWLLGVYVRSRREERRRREQTEALARQAEQAAAEQRARLARELHDVISHTLSVVVLQAAGARAAGNASPATLEKIENSGRESLAEMRRLLGVLRHADGAPDTTGDRPGDWPGDDRAGGLAPQPGVGDLAALAGQLTDAGLPVELTVDDACRDLPAGLGLSVYRIVQESLTNVLKHAGPARARVAVRATGDAVTIDVIDDGAGAADAGAAGSATGGHGLVGMRERVALFGGVLTAGQREDRGYAVHAELPREARPT